MDALFLVSFFVTLFFGLGFTLMPGAAFGVAGIMLEPASEMLSRLFGAALLTFPVLLWFVRRSHSHHTRHGMVIGMLVFNLISAVVLGVAMRTGLLNLYGWGLLSVNIALTLCYAWFTIRILMKPASD